MPAHSECLSTFFIAENSMKAVLIFCLLGLVCLAVARPRGHRGGGHHGGKHHGGGQHGGRRHHGGRRGLSHHGRRGHDKMDICQMVR